MLTIFFCRSIFLALPVRLFGPEDELIAWLLLFPSLISELALRNFLDTLDSMIGTEDRLGSHVEVWVRGFAIIACRLILIYPLPRGISAFLFLI